MITGIAAGGEYTALSDSDLNRYLDDYQSLGASWIRFDFDWSDIQSGGPSSYNWSRYDAIVQAATTRGIAVLGILDYCPTWALPSTCSDPYHCPPAHVSDFTTFVTATVKRYAPLGVHTWEVWNEPNMNRFTPASYTPLLKAAYTAIKQNDPTAIVLTGGTAPNVTDGAGNYDPRDWLSGLYSSGAHGYFDAVGHHPYCFANGYVFPFFQDWSAWSQMQDTGTSLYSIMTVNGDAGKKIWATEFGAPTSGDPNAVSEADQAQLVSNAYALFQAYSWSGPLFWFSYKDSADGCYGLVRSDYSHKPAYAAYQKLTCKG